MLISEILKVDWIIMNLKSQTKEDLFDELASFVSKKLSSVKKEAVLNGLWEREKSMTTGIARNIALPHTQLPKLGKTYGVFGLSQQGIEYQSLDGQLVYIVICLIGDESMPDNHILVLKNLALLMTNPEFYPTIMKCRTPKEIAITIAQFEELSKFYFS